MAFTASELQDINNAAMEHFLNKGEVLAQNIEMKPMLKAFDAAAKTFPGGKERVRVNVMAGQGGGSLQGYSGDQQVSYYNPTGTDVAFYPWKEMHIGSVMTYTELKIDGVEVNEDNAGGQSTSNMSGRDEHVLFNLLQTKQSMMAEDYARSMDLLIHGDGSADPLSVAGIQSLIFDSPAVGTTGTLSRVTRPWWRNRAATAAYAGAGGQGAITVNTANGGALIEFLEKEWLQLTRRATVTPRWKFFAGSDFIAGYQKELRANGNYTMTGWQGQGNADGGMDAPKFKGVPIIYDPTLDNLGLSKRAYLIDMSENGIQLQYMTGYRRKKHNPPRPYDRYVIYNGITTTAVMTAKSLSTSAVYDIA